MRVIGMVNEKAVTPRMPQPSAGETTRGSGLAATWIALSYVLMVNDSSDRITSGLRLLIRDAAAGTQLPSTRELVAQYRASPLTVQQALRTLAADGLIESRPGAGTFVRAVRTPRAVDLSWQTAALGPRPARPLPAVALRTPAAESIAWHSGYPERDLLPERLVRAALTRAARADAGLRTPPISGLVELRAWFAAQLRDVTPATVDPPSANDVIVLPGSQGGLSSIFRSLAGRGRPVIMESPTYWGAILAAEQVGVEIVPIATTPDGPDPDELARVFADTGARVFYAQPTYANPLGGQWPVAVSQAVLDVVRAAGAFVVEDDWAHEFGIDAQPRPLAAQDDAGHVVYLRSLTKSVSPALRVAAVVARGPARDRILADRAADTLYVSGLLQAAALDVVTQPAWQTSLRAARRELGSRRDLLIDSLRRHAPMASVVNVPVGGLNLWVRLPDGFDARTVADACERRGLLVAPGDEWFPAEPSGGFVRLNFAGPDPASFAKGARILGRVLAAATG